ncbi:OsmC family protein [Flavobacterium sp.]|uniref:OsmC family protein n=1 Tax=Flavobacterium sp. TaxID=239 RepID=UPI0040483E96
MEKHSYNVNLKWNSDRKGTLSSNELPTIIEVATPPEFDKGIPNIWSPEHLYTASILSCFMTTFLAIAEFSKFDFIDFECSSDGILEKVDGKYLMTQVIIKPVLTITNPSDTEKAERILQKSEKACLISNSIKTEVLVHPTFKFE